MSANIKTNEHDLQETKHSLAMSRKNNNVVSEQARYKPSCTSAEDG